MHSALDRDQQVVVKFCSLPIDMKKQLLNPRPIAAAKSSSVPVPFLDLSRQFKSIEKEILAAVSAVCISQQYVL